MRVDRKGSPRITVVVPLYNKKAFIARTLTSVLAQSIQDIEVIVVDDGSTDDGGSIVATCTDPRVRLVRKENGGDASARNMGIRAATGEYIAFIDADDEWLPDHLSVLLAVAAAFPKAVAICDEYRGSDTSFGHLLGAAQSIEIPGTGLAVNCYFLDYLQKMTEGLFVASSSSTLIKRGDWAHFGINFFEGMKRGADVNFWVKLARRGDFVYCDYPGAIYHRDDPGSEMNRGRPVGEPMPDIFAGTSVADFRPNELAGIRRFLWREYLKNAYQNRGARFQWTEMRSGNLAGGWPGRELVYLAVRFAPSAVLSFAKRFRWR
jgi:glycosyltransferase involved in cell wall biosynthesis